MLDAVFSEAYEELRRLAARVREGDPSATLSPTALVNEAWLKLADSPHVARTSPLHFKRIAARAMRQVLIEAARRRQAEKRGGGSALVTFEEFMDAATTPTAADELLALDEAL
ncbi:MAG TPA: ECF-type sigma factor, partial [Gemmatimonadaceae bacterium]|nr:ECF-type sigma factor [Gemmatimonadaceae bacterium]